MRADQLLAARDGTTVRRRGVGRLRYVVSPDHRHWHLLDFMRFELRPVDGQQAPRRDRKTGFCIGDRYAAAPPARRAPARYVGGCGLDRPDLLSVQEGISPGHGDDYDANLEGQLIDITGMPAGRYVLVHRSDPDGKLTERSRGDNAASALVRLTWRGRSARVSVLRSCPDSADCRPAPARPSSAEVPWAQTLARAGADCAVPPRSSATR